MRKIKWALRNKARAIALVESFDSLVQVSSPFLLFPSDNDECETVCKPLR